MVEELFGSDHEFFKIFSSALGGIKLNSKYQTTNPQRASRKSSPNRNEGSPVSRRHPTTSSKKRKVSRDTLPSIKQSQDAKSLLTLSTSAQSERLRKPALKIHRNLRRSFLESAQAKRNCLSMMESSLGASYQEYRDKKLKELRPKSMSQNRRRRMMRKKSEQKLACTIGPTCSSHAWADHRSPKHSDKEATTSLMTENEVVYKSVENDNEKFYNMHVEYMRLMQEEQAKTIEMILKAQNE